MALFSFIGVEVTAITAKRVTSPRKNAGRASVIGSRPLGQPASTGE